MAKHIITQITDDLDGSEADQTVEFAIDGVNYEIDLNDKNATELRDYLQRYTNAGTRLARAAPVQRRPGARTSTVAYSNREQNTAIRDWARKHGYEMSSRGRIPQTIVDAFNDPNSRSAKPAPVQESLVEVPAEPEKAPAAPAKRAAKKAPAAAFRAQKTSA